LKKIDDFICFFILISSLGLVINSCEIEPFEPAEYVSIHIINHTQEAVWVYTGASILFIGIPSTFIYEGGEQSVLAKKGESVTVYGKDTNKLYGSRSFIFETEWEIH
jgi:predicted permease